MQRQQRGGTFLGFVVGVVVGLGMALAVAVYVTRVPVPFLDRNMTRTPGQDASEQQKNRDWDPNAPLAGKNAGRPAAASAAEPAASAVAGRSRAASGPALAVPAGRSASASGPAVAAPRTGTSPPADPLGDLARARASATTAEPFSYFVQAGAYRTPEDAEAQRAKLSLLGVEAKVTEREQAGRTVYRVRVGPFNTHDAAERVKERLDGAGMESALVRVQR